jgi:hypothetical protein
MRQMYSCLLVAITLFVRLRDYELAGQIEERLRLYQFECPYYENPRVPLDRLVAQARKRQAGDGRPGAGGDLNPHSEIRNPQFESMGRKAQDGAEMVFAE